MAHSPELKMKLRAAYIGGLPLEAAAEKVGVPYGTARNWYKAAIETGDDWNAFQKASLVVSGGGIEQALGRIIAAGLLRCEAITEKAGTIDDPIEAARAVAALGDTVAKLKAAGRDLMPQADKLATAMDVVKRLGDFVRTKHPRHGAAFAEILEPFADEIARMYG